MEYTLLFLGGVFLSVVHTLIPNHWVPIITISKYQKWGSNFTRLAIFIIATAHSLSTIIIGSLIGILGIEVFKRFEGLSKIVPTGIFILMGIVFISLHVFDFSKHHHHEEKNFHLLHSHKITFYVLVGMIFAYVIVLILLLVKSGIGMEVIILSIFIFLAILSIIIVQRILERKHKFNFYNSHIHTSDDKSIHDYHHHDHSVDIYNIHCDNLATVNLSRWGAVLGLSFALFFSPCIEIEVYYLQASTLGISGILLLSLTYWTITVILTYVLVGLGEKAIQRFKLNKLEHNEDVITGITLLVFSVLFYLL
ncbi:MAG: hypothetical protein N2712_03565 [Brevinematales bacterium]|nr:hypothetical protein [Brevinematales bacterium]